MAPEQTRAAVTHYGIRHTQGYFGHNPILDTVHTRHSLDGKQGKLPWCKKIVTGTKMLVPSGKIYLIVKYD